MDQETADSSDKCGLPMLLDEQKEHDHREERQKVYLCHPLDLDVCIVRLHEIGHGVVGVAFAERVRTAEKMVLNIEYETIVR